MDEDVPVGGEAYQGEPHRRRLGEVERAGAVHGRDAVEVPRVGDRDGPPRRGGAGGVHGHDVAGGGGAERGGEVRVPVEEPVGGGAQPVRVERPGQLDPLLHHIRVGAGGVRGVEVQAGLQRRQRQDVAQPAVVEAVDVGLAERGQGEVRRGVPG